MAVGDLRKIEVRYKHTRHWLWYITAISFVTGVLLAACLRTQKEWRNQIAIPSWRPEIIADHLKASREEAARLREEVQAQRDKMAEYEKALADAGPKTDLINDELKKYKVLTGLTEMEGPGIVMTLNDSTLRAATTNPEELEGLILHDYDLLRIVNELRASGAEAIAINGQRVVERTAIRCVGPVAHVNNVPIGTPYQITAIGNPQVIKSGLTIRGGIVDGLKTLGFPIELKTPPTVRVPAYSGPLQLKRAQSVEAGRSTGTGARQ